MPLLTQEQIAERIALYQALSDAIAKLAALSAALPEEAPTDLAVSWYERVAETSDAPDRVTFVVSRAWGALRKATLADAEKELADAEAAVLKFEAGEETDAPK